MNKENFIKTLKNELSNLPQNEVEDVVQYYTEYIEDAGKENEEKIISEIGSPMRVATQIKSEYAVKHFDKIAKNGGNQTKSGLSVIWWIILGIFAAPIALPVAILCGALAFTLFITCAAIMISILACIVALFGGGIIALLAGIGTLFIDFPNAIFSIGVGLAIMGSMLLLGVAVVMAVNAIIKFIAKKANNHRQKKSAAKGGNQDE